MQTGKWNADEPRIARMGTDKTGSNPPIIRAHPRYPRLIPPVGPHELANLSPRETWQIVYFGCDLRDPDAGDWEP